MSRFDKIEQQEIARIAKRVVPPAGGGGGGSGTVTQVNTGSGLTGGPITTTGTVSASFGSLAGTVCQGNDARLSDARTPTAHNHAAIDINSGVLDIARIPTGATGTTVCVGNDARLSDARTPLAHNHAATDINSGIFDISRIPTGTTGTTVCVGNDARLSDARTPLTHTHTISDISDMLETKILVETDCNSAGEFTTISLNTGTNVFTTASLTAIGNGRWGILTSGTASNAAGVGGIGSANGTDCVIFGTYKYETTAIVAIPVLSDATNTFFIETGFTDNRTGVPTDGVLFQYSHGVNGGQWVCLVYNNTVLTQKLTTTAVAINTWYKLKTVVNVDMSVECFINGVQVATTTDFPAGTAPNGTTRATANHCTIRKSFGTTARNMYVDYYNLVVHTSR